ncbi:hypothetical protein M9458_040293, partial [Cirrhinus mrigala]
FWIGIYSWIVVCLILWVKLECGYIKQRKSYERSWSLSRPMMRPPKPLTKSDYMT